MRIETIELSLTDIELILTSLEHQTTVVSDIKDLPRINRLREALNLQYESIVDRHLDHNVPADQIKQPLYLTEREPFY